MPGVSIAAGVTVCLIGLASRVRCTIADSEERLLSRSVEQRRHERFPSNLTITLAHGDGAVRNVSVGGIYFVTDVRLRAGQEVGFTLQFPDAPRGPISANCIARVVRLEKQGMRYGVGASISSVIFRRIPKSH